jgi:hypothetical protein
VLGLAQKTQKKSHRVAPVASIYIKKPWGLISHPWLFIPISGMGLWVTLSKIKIKVIKIKFLIHGLSFRRNIKPIKSGMSRKIFSFHSTSAPWIPFLTSNCLPNLALHRGMKG